MGMAMAGGKASGSAGPSALITPGPKVAGPSDVPNFGRINPKSSKNSLRPCIPLQLIMKRHGRCGSAGCGYERDF
jgi:hypothetical protein